MLCQQKRTTSANQHFVTHIYLGQEQMKNSNNGGHLEPHILVSATELTIVAVSSELTIGVQIVLLLRTIGIQLTIVAVYWGPVDYCCGLHPLGWPANCSGCPLSLLLPRSSGSQLITMGFGETHSNIQDRTGLGERCLYSYL